MLATANSDATTANLQNNHVAGSALRLRRPLRTEEGVVGCLVAAPRDHNERLSSITCASVWSNRHRRHGASAGVVGSGWMNFMH
eukprot:6179349-Pleurochrysis_carterae.AAC.1